MIRPLALALSLAFALLPAAAAATEPVPVPLPPCEAPASPAADGLLSGCITARIAEPMAIRADGSADDQLLFTIDALTDVDGIGVIVRDGSLSVVNGFLSASAGCNTFSAPVEIDATGRVSFLAQPASTAKFCPDLDSAEKLLFAVLLGRELTLDAGGGTLSSDAGVIAISPAVVAGGGTINGPVTPIEIGAGAGGKVETESTCLSGRRCDGGFLVSFVTAAIATGLFALGFLLGLYTDRRGGRTAPASPAPVELKAARTPARVLEQAVATAAKERRSKKQKAAAKSGAKKEIDYRV